MKLESIEYSEEFEYKGTTKTWKLEKFDLLDINLLLGKNASGKTRILNIINNLALRLSRDTPLVSSANYKVIFNNSNGKIDYCLEIYGGKVHKEELKISGKTKLLRGKDGIGTIYAEKLDKDMEFQTPIDKVASFIRRDSIQHPFLEQLYQWAHSTRLFRFADYMGQNRYPKIDDKENIIMDLKQTDDVVNLFREGKEKQGGIFIDKVLTSMREMKYNLQNIEVVEPSFFGQKNFFELEIIEDKIKAPIEQHEISQGMFRVLSLIIQLVYSELNKSYGCILVDDVGEGLDYERSCLLIKYIQKHKDNNQIILTTNNRFVMNEFPLDDLSIVERDGSNVRVFNKENAEKQFEKFELTGLNNFDFYATNYYKGKQ